MSYKRMTVKEWIEVPSNPIQRDTERHLARAKHLLTPIASHQFVFAAELPSGKLIKLDGHTRALAWDREMVEKPPYVYVGLMPVKSQKEAEELYKTFDSRAALETVRDKVSGAFSKHNFEPKSDLLASGSLMTAMRMAYAVLIGGAPSTAHRGTVQAEKRGKLDKALAGVDIYDMINEFSYELHALDAYSLRRGQIKGGAVAAFILSYRKHGHKILPFWQGVFGNEGNKSGREMDAIQATVELFKRNRGAGGSAAAELCLRALGGAELWLKDAVLTRIPTPFDTFEYLRDHQKPAERLIKAADIGKLKRAA